MGARFATIGTCLKSPESAVSASPASVKRPKPVVLLILDGWGHREDPTDNALAQAELPNWRRLLATAPHTLIHTEGRHVGLPDGQMGNSEVGHMNLGAGRIVYQDLTRIYAAIEDGSFYDNAELVAACEGAKAAGQTLHVFGLLSAGGVHSHETHIFAMLELAKDQLLDIVQEAPLAPIYIKSLALNNTNEPLQFSSEFDDSDAANDSP